MYETEGTTTIFLVVTKPTALILLIFYLTLIIFFNSGCIKLRVKLISLKNYVNFTVNMDIDLQAFPYRFPKNT